MPGRDELALDAYDINKSQASAPNFTPASDALVPAPEAKEQGSWVPGFVAAAGALSMHFAQNPAQAQAGQSLMAYGTKQLEEIRKDKAGREGLASALKMKPEEVLGDPEMFSKGLSHKAEERRVTTEEARTGLMEREVKVKEDLAVQEVQHMQKDLELMGVKIDMGKSEIEWNQPMDILLGGTLIKIPKKDAGTLILQANKDDAQTKLWESQSLLNDAQRKALEERVIVNIDGKAMRVSPETYLTYKAHLSSNATTIAAARIGVQGSILGHILTAVKTDTIADKTMADTHKETYKEALEIFKNFTSMSLDNKGRLKNTNEIPVAEKLMRTAVTLKNSQFSSPEVKAAADSIYDTTSNALAAISGYTGADAEKWKLQQSSMILKDLAASVGAQTLQTPGVTKPQSGSNALRESMIKDASKALGGGSNFGNEAVMGDMMSNIFGKTIKKTK